jgi:hypothetical protein
MELKMPVKYLQMINGKSIRWKLIPVIVIIVLVLIWIIFKVESIILYPYMMKANNMVNGRDHLDSEYIAYTAVLLRLRLLFAMFIAFILFTVYLLITKKNWWLVTFISYTVICILFIICRNYMT